MPVFKQRKKNREQRRIIVRSRSFVGKTRVHRHDFSFQNPSENPYHHTERNLKPKLLGTIGGLVVLTIIGLLFFHPMFRIGVITVQGLERTNYAEVQTVASNILNNKWFGFLPRNNYFLANEHELQGIIKDRFLLESVDVIKKFPNSVTIVVLERQPAVITLRDSMFFAVDINGLTVEKLGRVGDSQASSTPTSKSLESPWNSFPLFIYPNGSQTDEVRDKSLVEGVLAWDHFIEESFDTKALSHTLEVQTMGTIVTRGGWKLLVNFIDDRDAQFIALNAVFKQKNFNVKNVRYIDVRYPGKAYWQ